MVGKQERSDVRAPLLRWVWLGVLCLFLLPRAHAQLPDSLSPRTRISVLTVNPGTAVHSLWGHTALRVMDPDTGIDAVFNWGTFDPSRPWFIPRFAYGDMQYTLSVEPLSRFVMGAQAEERGIVEQELRLDQNKKQAIWELLLENMQPENRAYAYDFVRDNCSTRILDLLLAVDAVQRIPAGDEITYRSMVGTYLHGEAWLGLGIDLVFGSPMDRIVSAKDRAFLPLALEDLLDEATTPEGESLIRQTRTLLDLAWEPVEPAFTRSEWLFWAISILIVLHTLRVGGGPSALDRFLLGALGSAGLFLLLMWVGTQHWVTAWNADLLWAVPTHLIAALWWERLPGLQMYLRASAIVAGVALLLQLAFFDAMPSAVIPLVAAIALRFWMSSSQQWNVVHPEPA